jgi:hypothetical protein
LGDVNLRSSGGLIDGRAIMQAFEKDLALARRNIKCPSHHISEGLIRLGADSALIQKLVYTFYDVSANHALIFQHRENGCEACASRGDPYIAED